MRVAVFAGSFDPFTVGHLDIVRRAAKHFDKIFVTILYNPGKDASMFTLHERLTLIRDAVQEIGNVDAAHYDGSLVDFCKSVGAYCIIRGIRNGADVEYEHMLEMVNRKLDPEIETIYLLSKPELTHISSGLVRQLMKLSIGIEDMVPNANHYILKKGSNCDAQ